MAGHPGPDRSRQEHPAADPRCSRPPDLRHRGTGRPEPDRPAGKPAHQGPRDIHRLHLPDLQPHPTLSAAENVEAALVPLGVDAAQRKERALQALTEVGLGERARHLPSELSGGQQQRVAIARALVKRPGVLLADEPTGNLDEDTRDEIMMLLEDRWHEHDLTLVTVTHDSSVARRAQRTAVMRDGLLTVRDTAPARTLRGVTSPPR
ncbi:MAG TPA: ATP-binding cassette domain-containing protein [Streptosporangiaceae bacterium]|nr:ATP-binding cassette domain-containing protein [Streptosporangiaceae bacterium]